MALGLGAELILIQIIGWIFKIAFLFFYKNSKKDTLNISKIATTLIIFGWIGNLLDRLLISDNNGSYVQIDYFFDNVITKTATNISSMPSLTGWILLLIFAVIKFKKFKAIFKNT